MAGQSNNTPRSRRFYSEKNANNFSKAVNGNVKDLRNINNSKSNFKVSYTKGDAKNRTDLNNNYGTNIDDDFEDDGDVLDCSDNYESNCNGADVPDYIEEGTAHFDEEGNYAGGTLADQSDD